MKKNESTKRLLSARTLWLAAAAGCTVALIACSGGGGGMASVGSGGTGSAISGTIRGFGSIILNGVRYDDSAATITLDDKSGTANDLRLGMTVEVEASKNAGGLTGTATSIVGRSYVQGPVSAIDVASNQFTVLGLQVSVTPATVYDGNGVAGLAGLALNDAVEIYGIANGAAGLKSTRIEKIESTDSDASEVRLTGTVQASAPGTFKINTVTVKYQQANLDNLPAGISDGMMVRVKGTLSGADIVAANVRPARLTPAYLESQEVELEGYVSNFESVSRFTVNGMSVTVADSAEIEGMPALGSHVEVEGKIVNGILVAREVEVQDDDNQEEENELHGSITALNRDTKTFKMRYGINVKWDDATVFDGSLTNGAGSLTDGLKLDVKGKMQGNTLLATKIELDD
jgi:hypothetical protein